MNKVILDIETTGVNSKEDRIIQFAAIKVDDEGEVIDEIDELILPTGSWIMSIGAYVKHNIKPQDLVGKPHFSDLAQRIFTFMEGCDIIMHNGVGCDMQFLATEFGRCSIPFDVMSFNIYDTYLEEVARHPHTLDGLYTKYTGSSMEESELTKHNALGDVVATYKVFLGQQKEKEYGPTKLMCADNFINDLEIEINGKKFTVPCFLSGKYKYTPVKLVAKTDQPYITWCLGSTLSESTKELIRNIVSSVKAS